MAVSVVLRILSCSTSGTSEPRTKFGFQSASVTTENSNPSTFADFDSTGCTVGGAKLLHTTGNRHARKKTRMVFMGVFGSGGLFQSINHPQHVGDPRAVAVKLLHEGGGTDELLEIDGIGQRAAPEIFR